MKNKKKSGWKDNYRKSWSYIKESKNYIYSIIGLFIIFCIIGFFIPAPQSVVTIINSFIKQLLAETQGLSYPSLISFILLNNIQSSFFGMLYGFFLGVFPAFTAAMNGYLLGYVAMESVKANGVLVLWRIFPHGIFELPALFISLGLGMKFGSFIFHKNRIETLKNYFIESLRVFVFVVVPLLIIAAIIEGSLIFLVG